MYIFLVSFRGQKTSVSFSGLIQKFWRASPPLSYAESPPPPPGNHLTETPKSFVKALCSRLNLCFTDTHLIQTPHYQGQFALSLGK